MNDNKCEDLANAIIVQAYRDYKSALKTLLRTSAQKKELSESQIKRRRRAFRIKRDVESFFRSNWYRELTDADENIIMAHAKQEVSWIDS